MHASEKSAHQSHWWSGLKPNETQNALYPILSRAKYVTTNAKSLPASSATGLIISVSPFFRTGSPPPASEARCRAASVAAVSRCAKVTGEP